jgi:fructose transport system permease protein
VTIAGLLRGLCEASARHRVETRVLGAKSDELAGPMQWLTGAARPLLVLSVTVALFGVLVGQRFFSPFALSLIVQQVTITAFVAAAQALVILTGGIDLSLGAILVLAMVIMGHAVFHLGVPSWIALLLGLASGAACGLANGVLVSRLKLPPFIVTLGTWQIFATAAYLVSAHETIRSQDVEEVAPLLHLMGKSVMIAGAVVTLGGAALLALLAFLWYVLTCTAWGRHAYAVGDDPEAAALTGISVPRVRETAYAAAGLIAAFAGWVMIGRIGSITATVGELINVEAITAAVIGGIALGGGRGSILGALVGALTVGAFSLGLRLLGSNPQWITVAIGVCTVLAVTIDYRLRRIAR